MSVVRALLVVALLLLGLPLAQAHPGTGGLIRAVRDDVSECREDVADCDVDNTGRCAGDPLCVTQTADPKCVDPNDENKPIKECEDSPVIP